MPPKSKGAEPPAVQTTCRDCECFREQTQRGDEVEWGECWLRPPEMRPFESAEGDVEFREVRVIVQMPFRCYTDFRPKVH